MPLIIAHGLPKSGSTFLFEIATAAAAHANGSPQSEFRRVNFPESVRNSDYAQDLADDLIDTVEQNLDGKYFVLKTHGRMTPRILSRIQDRTLKAFTSFRDPRDCVISTLDAGVKDRARGTDRFFATLSEVRETLKPIKSQWNLAREWAGSAGILKIPYYLITTDQDRVVALVCNFIGLGGFTRLVQLKFRQEAKSNIGEFNKGIPDRFLDTMSPADVIWSSGYFMEEIKEIDALTERRMTDWGYREAYDALHARREERMKDILASLPA